MNQHNFCTYVSPGLKWFGSAKVDDISNLVSISPTGLHKVFLTLALLASIGIIRVIIGWITKSILRRHPNEQFRFWIWQILSLASAAALIIGAVAIWFEDPRRLTTAVGLVTAGLAFALQRVVTAFAAYFIILRGRTFSIGDRIAMAGVRGDVMALGFMQTTIMEMGQSPPEQPDEPAIWVKSRQYTGRIVTVTNDKIFDQPVYNYSREFPFLWDEMAIPISYKDNRKRAEEILLATAKRHTEKIAEQAQQAQGAMKSHYYVHPSGVAPKVYYRLTDNWVELTIRFMAHSHGTRELKDVMSREILEKFEEAGIGIASSTFEIVGLPPLKLDGKLPQENTENV
jgi:small-conductance mechanosensitive channel